MITDVAETNDINSEILSNRKGRLLQMSIMVHTESPRWTAIFIHHSLTQHAVNICSCKDVA